MLLGSQLPVTPVPEHPMPFQPLQVHPHGIHKNDHKIHLFNSNCFDGDNVICVVRVKKCRFYKQRTEHSLKSLSGGPNRSGRLSFVVLKMKPKTKVQEDFKINQFLATV